jgi:hypothetical protein
MKVNLRRWGALLLIVLLGQLALASQGGGRYVKYISEQSVWKYNDRNVWPGDDWYLPTYDDSSWPSGPAHLATSDESNNKDFSTMLAGYDPAYPTYYFRHEFIIEDASKVISMSYNIDYDDQYAVYLNGRMIGSSNWTCEWTKHDRFCGGYAHDSLIDSYTPKEPVFPRTDLSQTHLGYLKDGVNTIAVAIKNGYPTSRDAAFMLILYGYETEKPGGIILQNNKDPLLLATVILALMVLTAAAAIFIRFIRKFREHKKQRTIDEIKGEMEMLKNELDTAKVKFHHREIDEESFREMVKEYQGKMITLEVKLKSYAKEKTDTNIHNMDKSNKTPEAPES